jgi:hypothetical protein
MPAIVAQPFTAWGKTFAVVAPTSGNTGNVKVTATQSGTTYRITANVGSAFVTWGSTVQTPVLPTQATAQTGIYIAPTETTIVNIPGLDASAGNVYFSAISDQTTEVFITPGA